MDKVKAGLTPNPDVMCNRLIKFGAFHEKRGHDYDLIATGHYAQTETEIVNSQLSNSKLKWLVTSPDPVKDQTDFLAQIYDWQLEKAIFPIGHYVKDEVRQIAEREHLVNAKRKDSQGICFLGKINYTDYIKMYVGEEKGDVVELETGKRIGQHNGHWFYTAYKQDFPIHGFHSINGVMPERDITFKIRHTPEYHPATLEAVGEGRYIVHSQDRIHGVAPGQFCVIYDNRHHRCYGSGEITV